MVMDLLKKGKELLSEKEAESFYLYAYSHYHSGHWAEAADIFRLLCTRRPLDSRFWFGLGAALQEGSSYFDALHAWAMAALLKKEDPYPHFHAAECYFSLGQEKDAAKALEEALLKIEVTHPLEKRISLLKEQWKVA
jgi:type III secretion system low calcium response chaperone LcrH/SycD